MTDSDLFLNKPSAPSSATPPIPTTSVSATSGAAATVGALLRETRKRSGTGIADVARALRISQKYLEALEDDRYVDLPGATYAIGFVRSYAEHLHLDGDEVVRRYKVEATGVGGKKDLVFPKPMSDSGVPGGAVLALGIIFAGLAYGVWYWNSTEGEVDAARVEAVPEYMAAATDKASEAAPETAPETTAATPSDVSPEGAADAQTSPEKGSDVVSEASATTESPEANIAPANSAEDVPAQVPDKLVANVDAAPVAQAPTVNPAPVQEMVVSLKEPQKAPESAPTEAQIQPDTASSVPAVSAGPASNDPAPRVVAPAPAPASAEPVAKPERENLGPSRITVRALSNSWIQVRDEVADRLLFTRLLRKGDEYKVPNRSGLRLMTGNAGALELLVDGTSAPAIGTMGEVRRSVELDVDKLKAGKAVRE